MKNILKTKAFVIVLASAILVAGAFLFKEAGKKEPTSIPASEAKQVKVTIGYQPTTFYTYLFLAEEEGYFREAGIQPELIRIPSANTMFQSFLAGQLNMAGLAATEILLRGYETNPGGFVCPLMVELNGENVSDWMIVRKDSPIQSVQELKGKKIGSHPGTAVQGILKRLLEKNGVEPQSVTIQELKPDVQVDAVLSGAVDAIICLEPTGTTLIKSGECRVLYKNPFGVVVPAFPASYATLDREFIRANPDAAKRLVGAIEKSVKRYRELIKSDRPRIDRLVAQKLGITPEIASALSPVVYRLPDEWDGQAFSAAIEFYVANGVLKAPIKMDVLR